MPLSQAEAEAIARNWIDALNRRDFSALEKLHTDDFKDLTPFFGQKSGRGGVRGVVWDFTQAFPNWKSTIQGVKVDGDWVTITHTGRGAHLHPFKHRRPTKKVMTYTAVDKIRIVNGKIAEHESVINPLLH